MAAMAVRARRGSRAPNRPGTGAILVALALAVSAAACTGSSAGTAPTSTSASTGYEGRRGARRVTIAGDSITELSRTRILAALTDRVPRPHRRALG